MKACPICKTDQYVYPIPFNGLDERVVCACNVCGASTGPYNTEKEAEEAWDTLVGGSKEETNVEKA